MLRVRKDIPYNAFMLKVSEEFGMALVVDTYEDAEGELITLGENAVIEDLGTQLTFGAQHRPYALKIFLRQAGTKRLSTVISSVSVTGERRRSSEYVPLCPHPQSLFPQLTWYQNVVTPFLYYSTM